MSIATKVKKSAITQYRRNLRSAVRALWLGVMDFDQAFDAFQSAINRGLNRAWIEGAKECDIKPEEFTSAEQTERDKFIQEQINHISPFLLEVEANNKASGGKLTPQFKRVQLWTNQYSSLVQVASAMTCENLKKIWVLGVVEKHCTTCQRLAGKVKRNSFWLTHVVPRNGPNPNLECRGFNCHCELVTTDKPISRGPLPRTP